MGVLQIVDLCELQSRPGSAALNGAWKIQQEVRFVADRFENPHEHAELSGCPRKYLNGDRCIHNEGY